MTGRNPFLDATAPMGRWFHRRAGLVLLVAGGLLLVASLLVLRGGMLHPEVYLYLPYYLDGRPLLNRIFDLAHTDANMYSARELSYFFDLLDAHVIAWGVDLNLPHFLSASHYTFCALGAGFMWFFCRHRLHLSRPLSALLVLVFLTTPAVFLGGGYFRSAKCGVVLGLMACACCIAPAFSPTSSVRRFPWKAGIGAFLAALFMGLLDRQGFFLVLLLTLVLLVHTVLAPTRASLLWLTAPLAALAVLQYYNHVLGPALTERFSGLRPSMEFQNLPWSNLLADSRVLFDSVFYGPNLMLDNLRFLLGSVPAFLALALLVWGVWLIGPRWPWPSSVVRTWTPAQIVTRGRLMFALLPLALIAMNALMVLRVKAVVGLDFRRVYYGLPSTAFLWLLLACSIAALLRISRLRPRIWWGVLSVIVACNLTALIEHRHIVRSGLYRDHYRVSPELLDALRHLERVPATDLQPPYWPILVSGAPPQTDGIVRFFRQRQLGLTTGTPP